MATDVTDPDFHMMLPHHPFVHAVFEDAIRAVEALGVHPTIDSRERYVRVNGAPDRQVVAVYVHPGEMSIVLDAPVAEAVCQHRPGLRWEPGNATTGYVHVGYDDSSLLKMTTDLVVAALVRARAAGTPPVPAREPWRSPAQFIQWFDAIHHPDAHRSPTIDERTRAMDYMPAALADLTLPPVPREALRDALRIAADRGVHATGAVSPSYATVAGGPAHQVAVYIHRQEFAIALDTARADEATRRRPEFRFERTNDTTGYVHVPFAPLDATGSVVIRAAATDLIVEALLRSAARGVVNHTPGTPGVTEAPVEFCEKHHLTMANGRCDYCDE